MGGCSGGEEGGAAGSHQGRRILLVPKPSHAHPSSTLLCPRRLNEEQAQKRPSPHTQREQHVCRDRRRVTRPSEDLCLEQQRRETPHRHPRRKAALAARLRAPSLRGRVWNPRFLPVEGGWAEGARSFPVEPETPVFV